MIRRAHLTDVVGLTDCFEAAYARYLGLPLPDVTGGLAEDVTDHLVWVYEASGKIAGGIVVSCLGKRAHLRNIAVRPEYGGQGIGKKLINVVLDHLKAHDFDRIDLATHVDMAGNLALYEYLGWQETQRTGDKVLMSRAIE